jgi:uncharacterized OB-fold protein
MDAETYPALLPPLTETNQPYWDGCRAGELRLQTCDACATPRFPDSQVCPSCMSDRYHWQRASGRGTVWSWIVMHQRYFAALADELPYNVAFVHLEEGPYLMSSLVEVPEDLRVDEPVEVVFEAVPGDRVVPKFRVLR